MAARASGAFDRISATIAPDADATTQEAIGRNQAGVVDEIWMLFSLINLQISIYRKATPPKK